MKTEYSTEKSLAMPQWEEAVLGDSDYGFTKKANYGITALWKGLENQIYMIFAYMI